MPRSLTALLALFLAACSGAGGSPALQSAPAPSQGSASSDIAALRVYYDNLDITLPTAGPMARLDASAPMTRIAFGSCLQENRPQAIWDVIGRQKPDIFLMIGDNVYGDTGANWAADLPTLRASYAKLASSAEFQRFRAQTPMMTSWDDHDYGANDAGGSFAFKEYAEKIYETFWNVPQQVKDRPGVYESHIIGPVGQRVQIVLLDTRFFRSDLKRKPYSLERPALGAYDENTDPQATLLGSAQWQWLQAQLDKPAELRLIVSSIQVITNAHDFEAWSNFPLEQQRLYRLLSEKKVDNAVLLSGDRHSGALYQTQIAGLSKPVWELTASSLNFGFRAGDNGAREPDTDRVGGFWGDENFGQIDIDWAARKVTLTLSKSDGSTLISRDVPALQ